MNLSNVLINNLDFRADSEYFRKKYLRFDEFLIERKSDKISSYAKVSDGDHSKFPDNQINEIRYLQAKDIKSHFIEDNNPVFISKEYFEKNKRSHIKEENIILSIMGSVGDIAITPKGFKPTLANRAVAIIKDIKGINPYYLFTYLSTNFGQLQIDRQKNGGVQERINLDVLSKVKIPFVEINFQNRIAEIVKLSHIKRKQSQITYSQAEVILLKEIRLDATTNPVIVQNSDRFENVNVKSFKDSFGTTGRLDAEYYQKKYEVVIDKIKSYKNGFSVLNTFMNNYSTGFPFKSETYCEQGIPLIRINNISKGSLNLLHATNIPFTDIKLSEKDIAIENDILISMSGTIGNSCRVPKGIKAVVNQRIMRFTPKDFDSEVLSLIINSAIGFKQLERIGTGGVQTNISATDIKEIFIPKFDKNIQTKIAQLIEKSFLLKKQSEHLLEVAKRAVEIAIEENEEVANEYINQQL
ncbi:restriction endonuclease subunit S [Flavobacterium eburneipallidum]|uniref:restriction endonuclease subunit S n=1 Tax=Flavobacterium eburneipallidum TaxID=3003263 RepID=UPI0024823D8C|nr:restriction endonuclease subunit S [Flavobacterium eburneipallidum]